MKRIYFKLPSLHYFIILTDLFKGWRTDVTRAQNGALKDFRGTRVHFTALQTFLFNFSGQPLCIVKNRCLYTYICVEFVYEFTVATKYYCERSILTQIGNAAKCWTDYHWGADLAVTEQIRDIGQNVLQYSFQTDIVAISPSYVHTFVLIALLEEASIWNIITILCIAGPSGRAI